MSSSEHWKAGREGRDFQSPSGSYDKFRDAQREYQWGKESKESSERASRNYAKAMEGTFDGFWEGIGGLLTMIGSLFGIAIFSFTWLVLPSKPIPRVCKNILLFLGLFLFVKFAVYIIFSALWSIRVLHYNNIQYNLTREIIAAIISVLVIRYMNKKADKNTIYEEHFTAGQKTQMYVMTAFRAAALLCIIGVFFSFFDWIGFYDFCSYFGMGYNRYLRYIL